MAGLCSSIIFSQGFACQENESHEFCGTALHDVMLLQWTAGCSILPFWPEPLICPKPANAPPEAPISPLGATNGIPGASYSYSASAVDPNGDQISYIFDWGDDMESSTQLVDSGQTAASSHIWSKAGKYSIRAMAADSKGALSSWSEPLLIIINTPPDKPGAPYGPILGKPEAFYDYAISSTDADGDLISYIINWGDGTETVTGLHISGEIARANHSWKRAGTYRIKALAMDGMGAFSSWSGELDIIINTPPNQPSKPSGPTAIYAWADYAYSSSTTDHDGDELEYTFDWGDGNSSLTGPISSGNNASLVHSWSTAGDYQLRVIASDRAAKSNWSENLTVTVMANNRPNKPRELFGPSSGYRGIEYSYFTMAKDIDNDNITYSFDWGDTATSATDLVESGSIESASHAWSRAGVYQIKAEASDSKNASSGWAGLLNVTIIDNDPPDSPIPPSGPTNGRRMTTYKYTTSADDPDGDPVKYVFDWGDKTTSWTGLDFIDSGKSEGVYHKWGQPGTYQVRAMALDDKGAASAWSNSLIINISSD